MAKSILDIVIKLSKQGGADKETLKGLVQLKSGIMEAAAVAGGLVAAGYTIKKAFDATVGTFVAYADQVRAVTDVSRLSAEESSKLIQVTDDYKISQEDLLKVMQKNGDVYDFSIQGLAGMSDAYNALETSEQKAEFMQKRFGKSWGQFVELMEQGSDKIVASGEKINEALILDEAALQSARDYEKQLDNLSDSANALKISIGGKVLPVFNDLLEVIQKQVDSGLEWQDFIPPFALIDNFLKWNDATKNNTTAAMEADAARMNGLASLYATTDAIKDKTAATEEDVEATKAMSDANTAFLGILGSVNSTYQSYVQETTDLEEERADLFAEKSALIAQGYSDQSQEILDVNAKIAENQNKTTEAANQFEIDNKRILLGYLERKLTADGILDDKELLWLTEKGVAWGVYHATAVEETRAMINEANALINGLVTEKTFTLSLNAIYNTASSSSSYGAATKGPGAYRARGTNGWEEVPAGFPNDSYPVWMTSGEAYAVSPAYSGGNANMASAGGGGAVSVTVNINSMVNTADRERVKSEMLPIILDGIRSAQAEGRIR